MEKVKAGELIHLVELIEKVRGQAYEADTYRNHGTRRAAVARVESKILGAAGGEGDSVEYAFTFRYHPDGPGTGWLLRFNGLFYEVAHLWEDPITRDRYVTAKSCMPQPQIAFLYDEREEKDGQGGTVPDGNGQDGETPDKTAPEGGDGEGNTPAPEEPDPTKPGLRLLSDQELEQYLPPKWWEQFLQGKELGMEESDRKMYSEDYRRWAEGKGGDFARPDFTGFKGEAPQPESPGPDEGEPAELAPVRVTPPPDLHPISPKDVAETDDDLPPRPPVR